MKKDLGVLPAVYPMPVLMVAAYDKDEKVNVMNVAWGQICDEDKIILFIGEGKKTWLNIRESRAFTVALADEAHVDVADFFGIASGNKMDDKFERTGYHAVKSDKVRATPHKDNNKITVQSKMEECLMALPPFILCLHMRICRVA